MTITRVAYDGDGTTKQFDIPFPYLRKEHLQVKVGTQTLIPADFQWVNAHRIEIDPAPSSGQLVTLARKTPSTPLHILQNGQPTPAKNFMELVQQSLYKAEEDKFNEISQDIIAHAVSARNEAEAAKNQAEAAKDEAEAARDAALALESYSKAQADDKFLTKTGNAVSASRLATPRLITIGDVSHLFNGNHAISFSMQDLGFTSDKADDGSWGWMKRPDGIIEQWGKMDAGYQIIQSGTIATFPLAFPLKCAQIFLEGGSKVNTAYSVNPQETTKTQFKIYINYGAPGNNYSLSSLYWRAIGW